jgi:hypothetical protein
MKIIDGVILDSFIKGGTLKTIDGVIFDGLGRDEAPSSLSAIGYMKYYNWSITATLPVYNPADVTYKMLRIYTGSATGCLNLVQLSDPLSSQIRVSTSAGVLSIAKL